MLINLEQRTQAWYDWRNGLDLPDAAPRITATAASVIMGNSPFQTASQLWEQMVGLRPPTETNAAMQIGVDYWLSSKVYEDFYQYLNFQQSIIHG